MLELFSFELDERTFQDIEVYYLDFPSSWQSYIESKRIGNKFKLSLWPSTLGSKLSAVFPEIFLVSWKVNEPWLLADEVIQPSIIKDVCLRWFANEEGCKVSELSDEMLNESLVWNKASMGELVKKHKEESWRFSWIPALLARRFAKRPKRFQIEGMYGGKVNKDMHFYHVCFNHNHECMSELMRKDKSEEYFSYVIRFFYRTRGLNPERGILNVSIGMRRFLQKPIYEIKKNIHPRRSGSILIGLKDIFYKQERINSLSQWKFRRLNSDKMVWSKRNGDGLFADILIDDLQPLSIFSDPVSYLTKTDNVQAFVVFNDIVFKRKKLSKVNNGVGVPEKYVLYNLVKDEFSQLKPLPQAPKVKVPPKLNAGGKNFKPFQHRYSENTTITIELWCKNDLLKEVVPILQQKDIIIDVNPDGTFMLNTDPRINVDFIQRDSSGIVEALNVKKYNKKASDYHIRTIEKRLANIKYDREKVVSLIEIPEKEKWDWGTDPKQAIRTGFAKCGRITQFIYPKDENDKEVNRREQVTNSILDLLTDLGFVRHKASKLIKNHVIAALGLIRHYGRAFPIIYYWDQYKLEVKLFGMNKWYVIEDALLKATMIRYNQLLSRTNEHKKQMQSFYIRGLREIINKADKEVLTLVDARLRDWWGVFRNGDLELTQLPIKLDIPDFAQHLKMVRVNQTDDVPQYRIHPKGVTRPNRQQGLFYDQSGLFYSSGTRPSSMRDTFDPELKIESPHKLFLQQRLLELIVLGENDIEMRKQLAIISDQLRRINIAYDFYTVMPYPLHMNGAIQKYMTFINSEYDQSEFNETIIETDSDGSLNI